ncbi:MAG: hypothetical protein KAR20_23965, partial [Candidatus Heimdallarchaeota archaeon]|nr:hypothetical protein [Candidatus Heimdallarchaeota archaeon]
PELNDEFVKSVSDLDDVGELKDQIREDLTTQRKNEDENNFVNSILEKILEDAEVKYPPQMLENEIEGEVRELESRLKMQGMDLEMYLGIQDLDDEGLREQIKPNAEKRIQNGLLIGKISESEDIDISPEDITGEFQSILDEHFGDDEKARGEYMNSGDSVALLNRISSQVVTKKTLDFLMAVAQGEDLTQFLKPEESEANQDDSSDENPPEKPKENVQAENETDQAVDEQDQE